MDGIDTGYFGPIAVILALVIGSICLQGIGSRRLAKSIKHRCTKRTYGKVEYQSSGFYFSELRIQKNKHFFPHPSSINADINFLHYVVYSYMVDGRSYLGIDARKPMCFFSSGLPGENAEIYYNPKDRREFYSPKEDKNVRYGPIILIGIVILLAILICTILLVLDYIMF